MRNWWGNVWLRIMASLVVAPVVMTVAFIATGDLFQFASGWPSKFHSPSELSPALGVYPIILGLAEGLTLLPLIVAEFHNRRHAEPLPPGLCAAFIVTVGVVSTATLCGTMMATDHFRTLSNMALQIGLVFGSYPVGLLAGAVLIVPLVRRWRLRQVDVKHIERIF